MFQDVNHHHDHDAVLEGIFGKSKYFTDLK
jgi:hypothetical protein